MDFETKKAEVISNFEGKVKIRLEDSREFVCDSPYQTFYRVGTKGNAYKISLTGLSIWRFVETFD